jgi:hypothetical protein
MDGFWNTPRLKHRKLKQSSINFSWLVIVFLLHFVFCSNTALKNHKNKEHSKVINCISTDEQKDLGLFFYNLFTEEDFGYTLFGDKPMSFCFPYNYPPGFSKRKFYRYIFYIEGTTPFFKGLAVWNKLKAMGTNDDYSLILYEEKKYPMFAILVNKHAFLDTVNKNIDVVKRIYGFSATAESFLRDIEEKKIKPEELFEHHLLLGIILGYGRHSAELFQRRRDILSREINPPLLPNQKIPSMGFSSVEEELRYITERFLAKPKTFEWYTNTCQPFLRVTPVVFASDPDDPEALFLIKKYKAMHAKLISIFDKENWLEVILDKLIEPLA